MKRTFRSCVNFIVEDARNRPWFLALETMSTLFGISAALHLAIYNSEANFVLVWIGYIISSLGLSVVGYIRKSTNILLLMLFYTLINIMGLYNIIK